MEIENTITKRSFVIEITVVISVFIHAVVWAGMTHFGTRSIESSYLAGLVSDPAARVLPTPAPTPEATPKPTPPPKNPELPPPNKEAKDVDPNEKPKPVFGVTEESVVEDSDFSVRVGNTLMKAQEKDFTDPSQVRPYKGGTKAIKTNAPPRVKLKADIEYPTLARQAGKEGRVVLKVLISKSGQVISVSVVKADPPGFGFEQAAVDSVKKWVFYPPAEGADIWCFQPIKFNLEG